MDHFVVFGESHLRYLVQEYVDYYNTQRPHQGKDNLPLPGPSPPRDSPALTDIVCDQRLGGLLKHYRHAA